MKNSVFLAAAIAGFSLIPSALSAQTFTPSQQYEWEGNVIVQKGVSPAFACTLNVKFSPSTTLDSITFSGGGGAPCGSIIIPSGYLPTPVIWDSVGRTFTTTTPILINTPTFGDCEGILSVGVGPNPNPSLIINLSIPEKTPGTGSCQVISAPGPVPLKDPIPGDIS